MKKTINITIHGLKLHDGAIADLYECNDETVLNGWMLFVDGADVRNFDLKDGDIVEAELSNLYLAPFHRETTVKECDGTHSE